MFRPTYKLSLVNEKYVQQPPSLLVPIEKPSRRNDHISRHRYPVHLPYRAPTTPNMSLLWSATDLFNLKIKLGETTDKSKADCPATNKGGKPCLKHALAENFPGLRSASASISHYALDNVPYHLIENLAQLSLCGKHQYKHVVVAEGWKRVIADRIEVEWRKSTLQIRVLQEGNGILEKRFVDAGEAATVAERTADDLRAELAVAVAGADVAKAELEISRALV
jgi:hypothetical protein